MPFAPTAPVDTLNQSSMQSTFNLRRFSRLVRHDLQLLDPRYSVQGASMLSAVLFPVMMVVMQTLLGYESNAGSPFYRLLLAVGFPLFWGLKLPASIFFRADKKNRGLYFALLPASKCEKYWSMFIVSLVVVPTVLTLGSLLLDTLLALFRIGPWQQFAWQIEPMHRPITPWIPRNAVAMLLSVMAAAIWAGTFRNKVASAAVWIAILAWSVFSSLGLLLLWGEMGMGDTALAAFFVAQFLLFALMAFVGRRRLDRLAY